MTSHRSYRVFVSYTGNDLENNAAVVVDALRKLQHTAIDHKDSGATGERSVAWCMEQVDSADILVVLVAHRYGWIPSPEEGGDGHTSITWMEVKRARNQGKPVLPYLVDEKWPWPPQYIEAISNPAVAASLNAFKTELRQTIAMFFSTPSSLDGPVSRDIARAISCLEQAEVDVEESQGLKIPKTKMLKRPVVYIADCGVSENLIVDVADRLAHVGFQPVKPNYSGYYLDVRTEFYKGCDFGIFAIGSAARERYGHVMEEEQLVELPIFVYFEPIDMTRTGYGAPLSGKVLHLEDWHRRPEACLKELLDALKGELMDRGWTPFRTDLPDLEIVARNYWVSLPSNWNRPLERAGFTLRNQGPSPDLLPLSEIGRARFSLFVWGIKATQEDVEALLKRARVGAALVAIVDHDVTIPESVQEACKVFDLCQEHLNKSAVGTDKWEEMLELLRESVDASNEFVVALG